MRLGLILAFITLVLDQISKWLIIEKVMRPEGVSVTPFFSGKVIEVFPGFNLVMAWNRGVSFGMFNSDSPYNALVFTAIALLIAGGMVVWLKKAETLYTRIALGLVIGGAIGNVIDRLRFGAVADFVDLYVGTYHWPAFNVADSGITVGAIILTAEALFGGPESTINKA
jgi:signal peptidase II